MINLNLYMLICKIKDALEKLFKENEICMMVNLDARAGVRYSLVNPNAYI